MTVGTKSVLFGAHCWFLHPWFVAAAWTRLFGFPWDPRLWVAFFVHDLGYLAYRTPNMDGPEGEQHPIFGAGIMGLFDADAPLNPRWARVMARLCDRVWGNRPQGCTWYCFAFYHSRFLAKRYEMPVSRLCIADKLAIVLTPWWLYLPTAILSGEIHEYIKLADARTAAGEPRVPGKYSGMNVYSPVFRTWYANVQRYLAAWVEEHRDGRDDTWTPDMRDPVMERKDHVSRG